MASLVANKQKELLALNLIKTGYFKIDPLKGEVLNKNGKPLGNTKSASISFFVDGKVYNLKKQRLIWIATKGPIPDNYGVSRKEINLGDSIDNLCLVSNETKMQNALKSKSLNRALSLTKVKEIRKIYKNTDTTAEILAKKYGVSVSTIYNVIVGRSYNSVSGSLTKQERSARIVNRRTIRNHRKKIDFNNKIAISSNEDNKNKVSVKIKMQSKKQFNLNELIKKYPNTVESIESILDQYSDINSYALAKVFLNKGSDIPLSKLIALINSLKLEKRSNV